LGPSDSWVAICGGHVQQLFVAPLTPPQIVPNAAPSITLDMALDIA
jgi:hypothetical protein